MTSNLQNLCLNRLHHTTGSSSQPWVLGSGETTEVIVHRRGIQVKRRCNNCRSATGALPMQAVWEWFGDLGTPLIRYGDSDDYPPCAYRGCSDPGMDMHHFSPRNTFGNDADNWPVMPLCQEHHREWHTRMDGYRRNAKASA